MHTHTVPEFTWLNALAAVVIASLYIVISSLAKEPERQKWSAIIVGGAGATYLSGGLGVWEFVFCAVMVVLAYQGLKHYRFIGIAWLLHTGWDIMHHLYGNPIVPFSPSSSAGCAICDALMALWFFWGAPSPYDYFRRKKSVTA